MLPLHGFGLSLRLSITRFSTPWFKFLTIQQIFATCRGTLEIAAGLLYNQALSIWTQIQSLHSSSVSSPSATFTIKYIK